MRRQGFITLLLLLGIVVREIVGSETTTLRPTTSDAWNPMYLFFLTEDDTKPDVVAGINEFFDRYVTCNLSKTVDLLMPHQLRRWTASCDEGHCVATHPIQSTNDLIVKRNESIAFFKRFKARFDIISPRTPLRQRHVYVFINLKCSNRVYYPDMNWYAPDEKWWALSKNLTLHVIWQAKQEEMNCMLWDVAAFRDVRLLPVNSSSEYKNALTPFCSVKKPFKPSGNEVVVIVLSCLAVTLIGVCAAAGIWLWRSRGTKVTMFGRRKHDRLRLDSKQIMVNHSVELGSGAFANVYMATLLRRKGEYLRIRAGKSLKRIVAAKVCKDAKDTDRDDAMREVELMRALGHHQHIVQLIGYTQTGGGDVMIILEYCEKGNLLSYLRKEVRHQMTNATEDGMVPSLLRQLTTIGAHVSDGMVYLSSKKFVHRDLAARNILLTSDMTAKISDFGLCRYADEQLYRAQHARKLPVKWMAPESLRSMEFSTKSDVWSFGILMWEVFTCGDVPFDDVANRHTGNAGRWRATRMSSLLSTRNVLVHATLLVLRMPRSTLF